MQLPKVIIFDLDGTLIDSAPDLQLAANATLDHLGRDTLDLPTIISFIGNGAEVLVDRILDATGGADADLRHNALAHLLKVYGQNGTTHTRPYPGVIRALESFRDSGLPLGICTNKPAEAALHICDDLGLTQYFDVIIGAQPDQPKKPDPQSLMASITALNGDRDTTLYVGDSSVDYHTALNAQVPFRLFNGGYLNAPLPDLSDGDRFDDWAAHGIATG